MKCELNCMECHPKEFCSWRSFSAFSNLSNKNSISVEMPKLPAKTAHTVIDAKKFAHGSSPANIGGGIPPAIETVHEELRDFETDELNSPEELVKVKEEIKK